MTNDNPPAGFDAPPEANPLRFALADGDGNVVEYEWPVFDRYATPLADVPLSAPAEAPKC